MSIVPFKRARIAQTDDFQSEIDRFFDSFWRNAFEGKSGLQLPEQTFGLDLDVTETDKAYQIKADLPGLEEKDIDVTVTDGMLKISGERQSEHEEKDKTYHRVERSYGSFQRVMALPEDADQDAINARTKNGVLEIEIGKRKEVEKPIRKIAIKST